MAWDNGVEHIAGYLSGAVSYFKKITFKGGSYEFTQSSELGAAVLAAIAAEAKPATGYTINTTKDPSRSIHCARAA